MQKPRKNILTPELFTLANMPERYLEIIMSGSDVKTLQQLLNKLGFIIAENGAGYPGNETEYFGTLTKNALSKYRVANNILPSAGYFGPITRAQMKNVSVEGL